VDRSEIEFHGLWTFDPDGTRVMTCFGNMHPKGLHIDAKPIPGTGKIVYIFSPGHGGREHEGHLAIVHPRKGPDAIGENKILLEGRYRDPYPLAEDLFLVANDRSLFLVDGEGKKEEIYAVHQTGLWVHEPRPLRARAREIVIQPRVRPERSTGTLILADVAHGRNMQGVEPGDITELLVLEVLPKPINYKGYRRPTLPGSCGQEPITVGGSYFLERILGTVPVEQDGSAHFEVPANRPVFFVALDKQGMSVKRMQSFVQMMPGETTGCVGCHEHRTETPSTTKLLALDRPASSIAPIPDVPEIFDFPRDIQPILDKHCLSCHDHRERAGGVVLTGDRNEWYSQSYFTLFVKDQVSDGNNHRGNRPPRDIGSSASPLIQKIDGSHHDVQLSPHERRMVTLWIDSSAPFAGTYASLGTGMVRINKRRLNEVFAKRCADCHEGGLDSLGEPMPPKRIHDTRPFYDRMLLYNLSYPDKSKVLVAPLAKSAGGWAVAEESSQVNPDDTAAEEPHPVVFASTHDPDYRRMLAVVCEAKNELDTIRRFDMPGFRPNGDYIREMQRYGILPRNLKDTDPIDPYVVDQEYWKSFWHKPAP